MMTLTFKPTNNESEYEALIAWLSVAKALGTMEIEAKADSQIMVNQANETHATKGKKLKQYLNWVWKICDQLNYFNME